MEVTYFVSHNFDAGSTVPPHSHNCYELVFSQDSVSQINYLPNKDNNSLNIFNFSKQFNAQTAKLVLEKNNFVILPPGIIHDEHHFVDGKVFAIGFKVSDSEAGIIEPSLLLRSFKKSNDLIPIVDKIIDELFVRKKYSEIMVNAFLLQMIVGIHREFLDNSFKQNNFDYISEYIDQYFLTNIDIKELAKQFNYSESHFRLLFKRENKVSIGQYLINRRIIYIKQQLEDPNIPIKNIADSMQFIDYGNFSNFFKKNTGQCPREYRLSKEKQRS